MKVNKSWQILLILKFPKTMFGDIIVKIFIFIRILYIFWTNFMMFRIKNIILWNLDQSFKKEGNLQVFSWKKPKKLSHLLNFREIFNGSEFYIFGVYLGWVYLGIKSKYLGPNSSNHSSNIWVWKRIPIRFGMEKICNEKIECHINMKVDICLFKLLK